jgi:hypothetical protein
MRWRNLTWPQRGILVAFVLLAVFLLRPLLISSLNESLGIALIALYLLAYLFAIIALPLMAFALMRFAYSLFLRPYLRVWHINRIRNARRLKEVMSRSHKEN